MPAFAWAARGVCPRPCMIWRRSSRTATDASKTMSLIRKVLSLVMRHQEAPSYHSSPFSFIRIHKAVCRPKFSGSGSGRSNALLAVDRTQGARAGKQQHNLHKYSFFGLILLPVAENFGILHIHPGLRDFHSGSEKGQGA